MTLRRRHEILRGIREFFWELGFTEIETPVVLAYPSQEFDLEPFTTNVRDARGRDHAGFLRMSPEFSIKKFLGSRDAHDVGTGIFEIGPVFRNVEPWGGQHNPEFTMLEWYRPGATYSALMDDCEALIRQLAPPTVSFRGQRIDIAAPWERLTMVDAWKQHAGLDLLQLLDRVSMEGACRFRGHVVQGTDTYDDLFFRIFLTDVEPKLGRHRPTFVHDWPVQLAALARTSSEDVRFADRVELYIGGLELANGFSELTDATEQRKRFLHDHDRRRIAGKDAHAIDEEFLTAIARMPECAGIALGVDRLVMFLLDAATINDVRWLPASVLWPTERFEES
jgi:elongation factor P--(R)-beta-lysine ligase